MFTDCGANRRLAAVDLPRSRATRRRRAPYARWAGWEAGRRSDPSARRTPMPRRTRAPRTGPRTGPRTREPGERGCLHVHRAGERRVRGGRAAFPSGPFLAFLGVHPVDMGGGRRPATGIRGSVARRPTTARYSSPGRPRCSRTPRRWVSSTSRCMDPATRPRRRTGSGGCDRRLGVSACGSRPRPSWICGSSR